MSQVADIGVNSAQQLEGFVDELLSKTLMEPTLCETVAMLCHALGSRLLVDAPPPPPKPTEFITRDPVTGATSSTTFRGMLLSKCKNKFFERGNVGIAKVLRRSPNFFIHVPCLTRICAPTHSLATSASF